MKRFIKDRLEVNILPTREEMGQAAAKDIAEKIRELLAGQEQINMIFAAAPSQDDVLSSLLRDESVAWDRINAFHMDEYIGLSADAPQGFGNYLKRHLFDRAPFRSVHLIDSAAGEIGEECDRYSALLRENPVDIVVLGIGENGHIAFNDPHIALFNDPKAVKKVDLDEKCRRQQVNDGCFEKIEDVPAYALTLTIPTLFAAKAMFCVVPTVRKAEAVRSTVYGEISEKCPASILRRHPFARLYLDSESASELK